MCHYGWCNAGCDQTSARRSFVNVSPRRANDLRRRCSTFLSFLSESLDRHRVPPLSEAAEENAQNSLRCASAADLRLPSEMELLELEAIPAAPSAGLRPSTAQSRASASRDLRRLTEIRQHRADLRTRAAHWLRSLQPRARDSSSLLQLAAADKDGPRKRERRPDEAGRSEGAAAYRSLSPALRCESCRDWSQALDWEESI